MYEVPGTAGYNTAVQEFSNATMAIAFDVLHEPFLPFIPTAPSRVLDVGAGIGRDAVELSTRGHDVIAVEPLPVFRAEAKRLFPDANVHWIGDSLPMLRHVRSIARSRGISQRFDFVLASAVWHHLDDGQRVDALAQLSELIQDGGFFAVSLRHGPPGLGRSAFPVDISVTVDQAEKYALRIVRRVARPSLIKGKSSVSWTHLVFEKYRP